MKAPKNASDHPGMISFLEHLNAIQDILDSWVSLLDSKYHQFRIPDPMNYLSIIVLGDQDAGKSLFIRSLLGIPIELNEAEAADAGFLYQDLNSSELSQLSNDLHETSAPAHEQPFTIAQYRTNLRIQHISSGIANSQSGSAYGGAPKTPQVTTLSSPFGSLSYSYDIGSAVGDSSPRSSTGVATRASIAQRRKSIIHPSPKFPSCLPKVIHLKRGPEQCSVTVPVRRSIFRGFFQSDVMLKSTAFFEYDTPGQLGHPTSLSRPFFDANTLPTMLLDAAKLIAYMERTYKHLTEYTQTLSLLKFAVDQEDIIKLEYQEVSEPNDMGTAEPGFYGSISKTYSSVKPSAGVHGSDFEPAHFTGSPHFASKLGIKDMSAGPLTSFASTANVAQHRVPPLSKLHLAKGRSSISQIPSARDIEVKLALLHFHLKSTRFLPYYVALARLFENVAYTSESLSNSTAPMHMKEDVVVIKLSAPSLPNIRIIEVPGVPPEAAGEALGANESLAKSLSTMGANHPPPFSRSKPDVKSRAFHIRERAKHVLRDYAFEKTSLFVNVIDANSALKTNTTSSKSKPRMPDSLRWIVELEPQGTRTLVILSKIDQVQNFGQLVTSIYTGNLPWAKDYERRAAAMFYKRYMSNFMSKQAKPEPINEALKKDSKARPLTTQQPRRVSFKSLGLHHPKTVGVSFLCQLKQRLNGQIYEISEVPTAAAESYQRLLHHEEEVLSKFSTFMSEHFDSYFGFKCLIQALINTVCMTIGSQCVEPAAIVLNREYKKIEKKVDTEQQKQTSFSPLEKFNTHLIKYRDQIRKLFLCDQSYLNDWYVQNNLTPEKPLRDHMMASSAPFIAVVTSACDDVATKLCDMDDNTIFAAYQKLKVKINWIQQLEAKVTSPETDKNETFARSKLQQMVDFARIHLERSLKLSASYLRTCIQSIIRSSFDDENYSEDQFLSIQALINGLYQLKIGMIRKTLRSKCEQWYQSFYDCVVLEIKTQMDQGTFNATFLDHLLSFLRPSWRNFILSITEYVCRALMDLQADLLLNETEESPSNLDSESQDWLDSLKKIAVLDSAHKSHNNKLDQLVLKFDLYRQAMQQMEHNILRYPLLYHFSIASVTHSQFDHQAWADRTASTDAQIRKRDLSSHPAPIEEESAAGDLGKLDPRRDAATANEKMNLMNPKTLSFICSGSIGAALLYSLTKK